MPKSHQRLRGLILRKGIYHIDKVVYGKRICESTHTSCFAEAKELLALRISQVRLLYLYGCTFEQAAERYLAEFRKKRSIGRDARAIRELKLFIGELVLARIHQESLRPFMDSRLRKGLSPGSINREISVVRMILNLAYRVWRDASGLPLLPHVPFIPILRDLNAREPYPLGVDEQALLFSELECHLRSMALFKVNTGLRSREVCSLRWEWEIRIPELDTSIIVIPRAHVKSRRSRFVFRSFTSAPSCSARPCKRGAVHHSHDRRQRSQGGI